MLCLRTADGKVLWQQTNTVAEVYGKEKAADFAAAYDRLDRERNDLNREQGKVLRPLQEKLRNADRDERKAINEEIREKQKPFRPKFARVDQALRELSKKFPRKERGGEPGNAAATPACDGKHVAAVFGTGIVGVYTTEGKRLWLRFLETPHIGFGHSASPVIVGNHLIVHLDDLIALELTTGKELWRMTLPPAHASSLPIRLGKEDVLVTPAGAIVRVRDGKVVARGKYRLSESSPVLVGDILYASASGSIQAFRLSGDDDTVTLEPLWKADAARDRRTPSSLSHDGLLYAVTTGGMLEVLDEKTGELVYKQRLPMNQVYSSVTLAGSYLYVLDTRGKAVVFKPGRRYERVALNTLEGTGGSPVFVGDRMYVRGQKHLYCLSAKEKPE